MRNTLFAVLFLLLFAGCSTQQIKQGEKYTILIEIFGRGSKQLADEMVDDLQSNGFKDGFVLNKEGYFFICVGHYKTKGCEKAIRVKQALKNYKYKKWGNEHSTFIKIK